MPLEFDGPSVIIHARRPAASHLPALRPRRRPDAADTLLSHLANPVLTGNQPLAVWHLTSMRSGQWREQVRVAIKIGAGSSINL